MIVICLQRTDSAWVVYIWLSKCRGRLGDVYSIHATSLPSTPETLWPSYLHFHSSTSSQEDEPSPLGSASVLGLRVQGLGFRI